MQLFWREAADFESKRRKSSNSKMTGRILNPTIWPIEGGEKILAGKKAAKSHDWNW